MQFLFILLTVFFSCNAHPQHTIDDAEQLGEVVNEISNDIWYVYQDKKDNYWFGSNGHGVYQLKKGSNSFTQYTTRDGLANDSIRGIQEDKLGHLFFTTRDGISKYDGNTISTLALIRTDSTKHNWKLTSDDLWFKGMNGDDGVYRYDGKSVYYLEFPKHYMADAYYAQFPNKSWSPYEVYSIYKDGRGAMWFGTGSFGLCRFDGKSLCWMYEEELTFVKDGGSFGIRSILEDKAGKFWICNTHYRYNIKQHYDQDERRDGNYLVNYSKEAGIENLKDKDGNLVYFLSIVEDKAGDLWMATYDSGVYRYNGISTQHYTIKDGDKASTIFTIYKDNHDNLWLGTHNSGVYKFNGTSFEPFVL